jgi:sialate O-acetylesterase
VLRESQFRALALPNTGMASAIDLGQEKNIHPYRKEEVGERLALAARKVAYGENIVAEGPVFQSMEVKGDKAFITFKNKGGGLVVKDVMLDSYSLSSDELKGFAICGTDKKFVWADAVIKGDAVEVSSPRVKKPMAVRYAWQNFPLGNLYNAEGLPAVPFRTDDYEINAEPTKPVRQ